MPFRIERIYCSKMLTHMTVVLESCTGMHLRCFPLVLHTCTGFRLQYMYTNEFDPWITVHILKKKVSHILKVHCMKTCEHVTDLFPYFIDFLQCIKLGWCCVHMYSVPPAEVEGIKECAVKMTEM